MSATQPIDLQRLSGKLKTASTALGEADRPGDLVMKPGRIARPTWNIRNAARPEVAALMQLALNDVVFVERSMKTRPEEKLSWLYVYAQPGNGDKVVEGWVRSDGVLLDPPEPEAKVEYIACGTNLLNVAAKHYKPQDGFKWGDDARFYVAALAYVNKNYGGLIFPNGWTDADFKERGRWADIGIKANHAIWIPKREYLQPLKGQFVSSGSISYELYLKIRNLAAKVWEAVVGTVAFAAGLVHGALQSVYDALADVVELVQLVWKILRSLLTWEIVKDAKKLWDTLKEVDWRQAMGAIADDFMAKWEADSTWARCYFQGEVVGYVIGMAILAFLTAGATAVASAAAKASKLARILQAILDNPVVKRVLENAVVKKIVDKGKDALDKAKELKEKLARTKQLAARAPLPPGTLQGNPPLVRLGTFGRPGNLNGYVRFDGEKVIYKVEAIVFEGATTAAEHEAVALARQAHREMIVRAAEEARNRGQKTFLYYGESASPKFQKSADDLASKVGVPGSGRKNPGALADRPNYEVTLDVAKVLASNPRGAQ